MNNTKGHIAAVTCGQFHPKDPHCFITSSQDGSLRQWDLNAKLYGMDQCLPQKQVIKQKDRNGLKTGAETCSYTHKGDLVMVGC